MKEEEIEIEAQRQLSIFFAPLNTNKLSGTLELKFLTITGEPIDDQCFMYNPAIRIFDYSIYFEDFAMDKII